MGTRLDVFALDEATQRDEHLLNVSVQVRPAATGYPGPRRSIATSTCARSRLRIPRAGWSLGSQVDRLGQRQPVLHWRLLDQDWASILRTTELVASALRERHGGEANLLLSADDPWPDDPAGPDEAENSTWGNHHMGTTRMGDGPDDSVVDQDCLLHGTANLYLAGSSVFPTGGCANPTFTIVALAHRLVDHLTGATPPGR